MANISGKFRNCCRSECCQLNYNNASDDQSQAPTLTDEFDLTSENSYETTTSSRTPIESKHNFKSFSSSQSPAKIAKNAITPKLDESCPIHAQKKIYELEEKFWAKWKPGHVESILKKPQARPNCPKIIPKSKYPLSKMAQNVNSVCSELTDCTCNRCKGDLNSDPTSTNIDMKNYVQCKTCHKYIKIDEKGGDCIRCLQANSNMGASDSSDYNMHSTRRTSTIVEDDENEESYSESGNVNDNRSNNPIISNKIYSSLRQQNAHQHFTKVELPQQSLVQKSKPSIKNVNHENNQNIQVIFDRKPGDDFKFDYTSEDTEYTHVRKGIKTPDSRNSQIRGTEEIEYQTPNINSCYTLQNDTTSKNFVTPQNNRTPQLNDKEGFDEHHGYFSNDSSYWHNPDEYKSNKTSWNDNSNQNNRYYNSARHRHYRPSTPKEMLSQILSNKQSQVTVYSQKANEERGSEHSCDHYRCGTPEETQKYEDEDEDLKTSNNFDTNYIKSVRSSKSYRSEAIEDIKNDNTKSCHNSENGYDNYSHGVDYVHQQHVDYAKQNTDPSYNNYDNNEQGLDSENSDKDYYQQSEYQQESEAPELVSEYDKTTSISYYHKPNQYKYGYNDYTVATATMEPHPNFPSSPEFETTGTSRRGSQASIPKTPTNKTGTVESTKIADNDKEAYDEPLVVATGKELGEPSGPPIGLSRFNNGNRCTLKPHSYPLKPILKNKKRALNQARSTQPKSAFKFTS